MSNIFKIVVTGPVGAGKSTFIRTISEIDVVDTDCKATDEVSALKPGTTVAMDFGRITLGDDMWVQIYGTPGQTRFDFMWEVLIERADAYILLVPAHRPADMRAAQHIREFMAQRTTVPMLIGITHANHPDAWAVEDIQMVMADFNPTCPYITVDPTCESSTAEALMVLVEQMMMPAIA